MDEKGLKQWNATDYLEVYPAAYYRKLEENFEGLVYDLCSGKGKTRSNKELSINRENHWKNCILTNGERPLSSYVTQGGAINRILELECSQKIYDDPHHTAEVLKKNYGFL